MRHLLIASLVSTLALGCTAEEPGAGGKMNVGPDAGTQQPPKDGVVPLSVGSLVSETNWYQLPVRGTGPAGGSVRIEGGEKAVTVQLGSDGSFCVNVPLSKGPNSLGITARDAEGKESRTITEDVLQEGEPTKPGEGVDAQNKARGAVVVQASTNEDEGSYTSLTDGDLSSFVKVQDNPNWIDYLTMQLPAPGAINKIRIVSSKECAMGDYLVHTTENVTEDMDGPPNKNSDIGDWTFRGRAGLPTTAINVTNCSSSSFALNLVCHEFSFDSQVISAIGLRFETDACSNFVYLGERDMHEIQAWSPAGAAPPDVSAPSCQGGSK